MKEIADRQLTEHEVKAYDTVNLAKAMPVQVCLAPGWVIA